MDEITSIVKDYLNQNNTDYAIFINGVWGSGKTYYVKIVLFLKSINLISLPITELKIRNLNLFILVYSVYLIPQKIQV